jgi:hypothetical protein
MRSELDRILAMTAGLNRREFLHGAAAGAAILALDPRRSFLAPSPKDDVIAKIAGQHDQTVKMLQDWIALPSIAAENCGYPRGADHMAKLARGSVRSFVEFFYACAS